MPSTVSGSMWAWGTEGLCGRTRQQEQGILGFQAGKWSRDARVGGGLAQRPALLGEGGLPRSSRDGGRAKGQRMPEHTAFLPAAPHNGLSLPRKLGPEPSPHRVLAEEETKAWGSLESCVCQARWS